MQRQPRHQWTLCCAGFVPIPLFEARQVKRLPAIQRVCHDGESHRLEMDANLVCSCSQWLTLKQRPGAEPLENDELRARPLSTFAINADQMRHGGMRRKPGVHLEAFFVARALDQGDIPPLDQFRTEGICE